MWWCRRGWRWERCEDKLFSPFIKGQDHVKGVRRTRGGLRYSIPMLLVFRVVFNMSFTKL
jgi:hypothetical protein